jgi:hypothetical protein
VGLLIVAMPLLAFAGYLVAATWIGGWLTRNTTVLPADGDDRPFVPVLAGVLVLTLLGLIPVLTIATAIATLVGFGAVLRVGFHTLRGVPGPAAQVQRPVAAPGGA